MRLRVIRAILGGGLSLCAVAALAEPLTPADLARWKLTLPTDNRKADKADEVTNLSGYANPPWFRPTPDGIVFRAVAGGARTSGSTAYARSELREMNAAGRLAAWDCTGETHSMVLEQTLLHTTTAKPETTIGQIHDARNDNLMIKYVGPNGADGEHDTGRIEIRLNNDTEGETLDPAYTLGDPMWLTIAVDHGTVQVDYRNLRSEVHHQANGALNPALIVGACYFKAGLYIQACSRVDLSGKPNPVCEKKGWPERRYDAPEAWAEVLIRQLRLE
jgi:hypothetical protein